MARQECRQKTEYKQIWPTYTRISLLDLPRIAKLLPGESADDFPLSLIT